MRKPLLVTALLVAMLGGSRADDEGNRELTDAQRAQLQRDKILLTDRSYRQIFTPYVFLEKPPFITADAALNAWHVLFEDSIRTMEERYAAEMPGALDRTLAAMPNEPPDGMNKEVFIKASRRAKLVLGTASRLTGGLWRGGKELDDLIELEVRRVEKAEGVHLPEWLSGEIAGLQGFDYAVFRPAGFYTATPRMERYYRAVRWLQTVPFDLKREDQAAAMVLIIEALEQSETILEIAEVFEELLGPGAELDANKLTRFDWSPSHKGETNSPEVSKALQKPAVVLAGRMLPDQEVFNRTTNGQRKFPDSLEAAAVFHSPLAERLLTGQKGIMPVIVEARKALNENKTLYGEYATCLTDLFKEPEAGAPAFMKSEAWQRKCLNTSLAGWAQFRHTLTLQASENAHYFGLVDSDVPGFVEPCPEFFRHLTALSMKAHGYFSRHGTREISSRDVSRRAMDLLPLLRATLEPRRNLHSARDQGREPTADELAAFEKTMHKACEALTFFQPVLSESTAGGGISGSGGGFSGSGGSHGFRITGFSDPERLIALFEKIAKGEGINEVMALLEPEIKASNHEDRWMELVAICHQLETLAHKQLRGVEPAKDEAEFIKSFGQKLAGILLYNGNSWLTPRDNAQRVAAVFNQPAEGFLLAGVGRPQQIRVLYPWKGREIECIGAVMPFREMRSPQHLSDEEWKATLDGPSKPPAPAWLKPIMTSPSQPVDR